ncbi:myophilin-like [Mizuhopecten yessoensis]|uniref:Transgelin n=1 Tax=Mizuhopecten yessoensis TaxID=6573 RepID=A0A210QW57_MIZYE|nr:myophilin-like [Mizuhopecten yessoensis]OWF52963.1 Myophilin [Mizuhopecten yessoensis]
MSANRATKSGLAREAQDKINSKYSEELACKVLQWVQQNTGESFSTDGSKENFYEVLNDGYILGRLAMNLGSKKVADKDLSKRQTMSFKKMDLIGKFIEAAKGLGVADCDRFQTVDLTDQANLNQVVVCLDALGRKMGTFGVKEATKNERQFTKEQLDAGKNVISLQYGSNQGASQAGQNFGCQRHIID